MKTVRRALIGLIAVLGFTSTAMAGTTSTLSVSARVLPKAQCSLSALSGAGASTMGCRGNVAATPFRLSLDSGSYLPNPAGGVRLAVRTHHREMTLPSVQAMQGDGVRRAIQSAANALRANATADALVLTITP